MKTKVADIVAGQREKGRKDSEIIDYLVKRQDRKDETISYLFKRNAQLKQQLEESLIESGRLITVTVDQIHSDCSGSYCWHKNKRYRYEGSGVWKRSKAIGPPISASKLEGIFKVKILLADEDMPRVYTSVATGTLMGKHVLLCDDFLVNIGDEFTMIKKEKKNA